MILQSLREVTAPSDLRKAALAESYRRGHCAQAIQPGLGAQAGRKNNDLHQALESQRRAHDRIIELNTSLEQRVRERTTELEQTHRRLLDVSRLGGMAEVAESVLHNVGNALNSVNTSAGLLLKTVKKSTVSKLPRIVTLLREHAADLGAFIETSPQGRQLPPYLIQLFEQLGSEQVSTVAELHLLQEHRANQGSHCHATALHARCRRDRTG